VIDLESFVPRSDIDQVYFDTPNYIYPDVPIAVEGLRVIGAAMAEAGVVGIGPLTLSRRERMVMVEPRGIGMALFTLRAADDSASCSSAAPRAISMPRWWRSSAIIGPRIGTLDPSTQCDRSQEAWRALIEAKSKAYPSNPERSSRRHR
jgi:DNA end-binding protein Ku